MREQCIPISTERLLHRIKLAGMCMQDVTRATGTNIWTIAKRCKTTITTAQAVANVLHCEVADIMPPTEPATVESPQVIAANMLLGPECYESGKCFARNSAGRCTVLSTTYGRYEKKCPFRKEKRSK